MAIKQRTDTLKESVIFMVRLKLGRAPWISKQRKDTKRRPTQGHDPQNPTAIGLEPSGT